MAKIKFPLELKEGYPVRTIEELREHFDLQKILEYLLDGKLKKWLEDRRYMDEAEAVSALDTKDTALREKLCSILSVDINVFEKDLDWEDFTKHANQIEKLKQYTSDKNIWKCAEQVAYTHEDLAELLDKNYNEIYLCGDSFRIPYAVRRKKYIGVNHPDVYINASCEIHLKEKEISFEEVHVCNALDSNGNELAASDTLDYQKAVEWYEKWAERGFAWAQFCMGRCYDNGEGVEQDYGKALEWYHKSAENGDASAMNNIGMLYDNGEGVKQDYDKALEWYYKSAENGNALAMHNIGILYEFGRGVEKDYGKALEWYHKSIENGNTLAIHNIGILYELGRGVEKDYSKAAAWYLKAAEKGDPWMQYKLANYYENGIGVEQNRAKAVEWYQKAARQENKGARERLKELREGLYFSRP